MLLEDTANNGLVIVNNILLYFLIIMAITFCKYYNRNLGKCHILLFVDITPKMTNLGNQCTCIVQSEIHFSSAGDWI